MFDLYLRFTLFSDFEVSFSNSFYFAFESHSSKDTLEDFFG